jgi:integrase
MTVPAVLDSAGRRRSPATLPGFHAGRAPRNKGMLYPADPPTVEEIIRVMRHASEDLHGFRLRAMIVMLWRGGLRIQEALALSEHDLDPRRGSVLVRCGKGGRRREVGMDAWGWENLRPWLAARLELPAGPARARQPRHHEHLPAGDRHRGDHLDRARASRAHDVRDSRTAALKEPDAGSASAELVLAPRVRLLPCSTRAVLWRPAPRTSPGTHSSSDPVA